MLKGLCMLEFFSPEKPPSPVEMLTKLSENGKCLITGESGKVTPVPVDTNPDNFLPSNVSCVSDEIASGISYTLYYNAELWDYKLEFESSPVFMDYNLSILSLIRTQCLGDGGQFQKPDHKHFVGLFEYLTKKHVKGIHKISLVSGVSMDNNQFQGYLIRELGKQKRTTSSIVTPNLGIVKS